MKNVSFSLAAALSVSAGAASAQSKLAEKDTTQIHKALDGLQAAWTHHDMTDAQAATQDPGK